MEFAFFSFVLEREEFLTYLAKHLINRLKDIYVVCTSLHLKFFFIALCGNLYLDENRVMGVGYSLLTVEREKTESKKAKTLLFLDMRSYSVLNLCPNLRAEEEQKKFQLHVSWEKIELREGQVSLYLDQEGAAIWMYIKWRPGRNEESWGGSLANLGPDISHAPPPTASVLHNLPRIYTQS